MIPVSSTIAPINQPYSHAIVNALENIMNRFYSKWTSTVFITQQSSLTIARNGYLTRPNEIAGEMMRVGSNHGFSVAYVIENCTQKNWSYHRFYNIFLVDSYDSFR